jgi:hypothetical protein
MSESSLYTSLHVIVEDHRIVLPSFAFGESQTHRKKGIIGISRDPRIDTGCFGFDGHFWKDRTLGKRQPAIE